MNNNEIDKKIEALVKEALLKQESINNGMDINRNTELDSMLIEETNNEKHK